MKKYVICLIVSSCALVVPAANACKPLLPKDQVREFVMAAQPPDTAILTGVVTAVKEDHQADGRVITDTMVRPIKWWMGVREDLVIVRTTVLAGSPCPNLTSLNANVGERWLLGGLIRHASSGSWLEPRASMRLDHGHLPIDVEKQLRRINVPG
ncbi:hypothetical protein [Dyella sp. GSA-30]|uniref:hypothetical protein n=1 Tax=Dyella sp. GSA-30 TaxID=2994496 RepID=UPI00249193A5|nr:hypothetical protein [Dyella sp. GSA-30]